MTTADDPTADRMRHVAKAQLQMDRTPFLSRNTQPKDLAVVSGVGECFFDSEGRRYLDFCSQTLNLSLGHCHPEVNAAIKEALGKLTHVSSRFGSSYVEDLASEIIRVAPPGLAKVNLKVTSGTSANEGALKAAYKLRKSTNVLAFIDSHHGQSIDTMRVSGKHFDKTYLDRKGVIFVDHPNAKRSGDEGVDRGGLAADQICETIRKNKDSLAAVILEPIMVDAGVLIPTRQFLQDIRSCTSEHGIVLIFDEVQTAFGWTGHMFAADYFGVTPDVLTASKGLAAGLPLGAILLSEQLDVLDYGEHEITHGANVLSCSAALVNMRLLTKTGLLSDVQANGEHLLHSLRKLRDESSTILDVRGVGYVCGVEIDDAREGLTDRLFRRCLESGLVLRKSKVGRRANVLQFKPPLITSRQSIDEALGIFRDAIKECERC